MSTENSINIRNKKASFEYSFIDKLLIIDLYKETANELAKRLAYTHNIYQLLFECKTNNLIKKLEEFNWQSIYKENFCLRINGKTNYKEKELAGYIWGKIKRPKVKLEDPKTLIELFFVKNKVYCGLLSKKIKKDFEKRKAHLRPELHPTSLHPKLARCLVNLSGAEMGSTAADPFCGSGGILIEAGLMGLKPVGYDLYDVMIRRAKINLDYYKIRNYKLINKDALKINKKYDYIVTDPPYGLNTSVWIRKNNRNKKISLKQVDKKEKTKNLESFYLQFLKNLKKILGKRAVVIFPHYVNYKKLIKRAGFKIEKEFSQFIHRSLTRKIFVLSC